MGIRLSSTKVMRFSEKTAMTEWNSWWTPTSYNRIAKDAPLAKVFIHSLLALFCEGSQIIVQEESYTIVFGGFESKRHSISKASSIPCRYNKQNGYINNKLCHGLVQEVVQLFIVFFVRSFAHASFIAHTILHISYAVLASCGSQFCF